MNRELPQSHIRIIESIEEYALALQNSLKPNRVLTYIKDDFLIEDARAVIAEAYISEEREKFLILGAKSFNTVSQNALLKILEEPPRHIVFIILAPSKSVLLPTIRSRLPIKKETMQKTHEPLGISFKHLELQNLFDFVKEYERFKKHELRLLIERIMHQACHIDGMVLSQPQLEAFDLAYRLSELNGRAQSILTMLLMHLLPESRRAD